MSISNDSSLKASSFAALALAFASFGDAFLYPFLPVNFADVGVSAAWVGILLSVNRFIRVIFNTLLVHAFAKYGLRAIMILAVSLAVASTFGYGIASGVFSWLLFRTIWGLSFSAMRIGTLGYALQHQRKGLALGVSRGLQEAGPLVALLLAPILLNHFEAQSIFFFLAVLSMPALYFAFQLPKSGDRTQAVEMKWFIRWPSTLNCITLVSAMVIDGIVVVVLGVLLLHSKEEMELATATTMAAFYLGYKRICLVALSPAGGWIADKIGLVRIFHLSMIAVVIGLIVIVSGSIGVGAMIVFTFYSIHSAITPGSVSKKDSHSLVAVAENATWRDIGAAMGTLSGGLLIMSPYLIDVLWIATFALAFLLFAHAGITGSAQKLFS